jgi:hypothetical protein
VGGSLLLVVFGPALLDDLQREPAGVFCVVKSVIAAGVTVLIATSASLADTPVKGSPERNEKVTEQTVFVTGSLIPQRIKVRRVGTKTVSPLRMIDRAEIDATGRGTTAGAFVNDPSVRIIGH